MVFTKLLDSDKEQLAIFKAEHGTNLTSSMRALVMRGSSIDDAKKMVLSRQVAKAELLKEMERADSYTELQEPPTPKKPRAPRKAKTVVPVVEPVVVPEEEPKEDFKHMKITLPKPKKEPKAKAKAKAKAVGAVDDSSNINILL